MEALLLAGGKAERLGEAAQGLPKPLVPVGGLPLAAYAVARLVESGVTRVIVACRAGDEESFLHALAGLGAEVEAVGEEEPLGRGGGLRLAATRRQEAGPVLALNGDELLDVDFRALLSEHEASGAAGTIVVAQVRSPFGVVEVEEDGTITGFREAPLLEHWVNSGRLRARRGRACAPAGEGRPRAVDLPAARAGATAARAPARGRLADREHAEGSPPRRRVHRRASRLAAAEAARVMLDSPNYGSLDRFAFEARRVEKPWGWELIWAHADAYVGKVLFVRAGESLSLQFHREKDESWYVQSGRARLELGDAGQEALDEEVVTAGACFHFPPGTVHRVTALEDTTILEVSTPHLDDVVRLEDRYGREGTSDA